MTAVSGGTVGTQLTLPSGALLTLNADGTFSYDPNHMFDYLPAPGSGASNLTIVDTFSYAITGGDTATVTVTVSGVDTNDVLYDSAVDDTLAGGIGDDLYYVNNTGDVVIEAANGGHDTVGASVDYTLPDGRNIEVLSMLGAGLTGTGSGGADTLDSAGGPNTLEGLDGDSRSCQQHSRRGDRGSERRQRHGGRDRQLHAAREQQHRDALHARPRVDRHGLERRRHPPQRHRTQHTGGAGRR